MKRKVNEGGMNGTHESPRPTATRGTLARIRGFTRALQCTRLHRLFTYRSKSGVWEMGAMSA